MIKFSKLNYTLKRTLVYGLKLLFGTISVWYYKYCKFLNTEFCLYLMLVSCMKSKMDVKIKHFKDHISTFIKTLIKLIF